jgi:hypothetical protein
MVSLQESNPVLTMETLQLKQSLHELIEQIGDTRLLEAVYTLLSQTKSSASNETDFGLNTQQKALLDQAIAECDANPNGGESWETVRTRILASGK